MQKREYFRLMSISLKFASFFTLLFVVSVGLAAAQNKFEGYSFTLEADIRGTCPITYLPSTGAKNAIEVYIAGTDLRQKAPNISPCDGSDVRDGKTYTNGIGRWCFQGPEPMYEVKLTNGASYLWYPTNENTGFYNLKDFRPVRRTQLGKYEFEEPKDYTSTFRNAIQYISSRQGGTLRVPDGDFVVGTLDGVRRDPNYEAITLTSGLNIIGAGSNASVANSNLPWRFSPTRIRLRYPNQSIFRIGGCTNQITVKDLELMGNSSLMAEAKRDSTGTYGIEALGKWEKDSRTGRESPNSSQVFKFENITFQDFDKGIYVHNANDENCKANEQVCKSWHFDYIKVDHGFFVNNRTGIWIDTYNTDWTIANTVFSYIATNGPGDGIRIKAAGSMLIQQTFGGGYDYASAIGGTFLNVDTIGSLTVINSGSERGKRTLYTNPAGMITNVNLIMIGSVFGDPIELHGSANFISTGNWFGADTIKADPGVAITSTGDRFCYDSRIFACKDTSGQLVRRPNFQGGRMMFQTGRLPEGSGDTRIDGKPNRFGYNVELTDGLFQYDPNITFSDIQKWARGADGRPPVSDGAFVYCKDCRRGGECSQGRAGTDGAFAKRINNRWMCD